MILNSSNFSHIDFLFVNNLGINNTRIHKIEASSEGVLKSRFLIYIKNRFQFIIDVHIIHVRIVFFDNTENEIFKTLLVLDH